MTISKISSTIAYRTNVRGGFNINNLFTKAKDDAFYPIYEKSDKWKHWVCQNDDKACQECKYMHGKIYSIYEAPLFGYQLHPNCRCIITHMNNISPGDATKDGKNGADYWLAIYGKLPDYYISFEEASRIGWHWGESPSKYFDGFTLGSKIYQNSNGHLPDSPGRIWYEADINYYSGKRNKHRILYSNDGLIFVIYDHYRTFYEITLEGVINYETENNSKSNRFYRM